VIEKFGYIPKCRFVSLKVKLSKIDNMKHCITYTATASWWFGKNERFHEKASVFFGKNERFHEKASMIFDNSLWICMKINDTLAKAIVGAKNFSPLPTFRPVRNDKRNNLVPSGTECW
jgi:hypothetical protein